jgi:Mrp family chromosome partitioning ATPase
MSLRSDGRVRHYTAARLASVHSNHTPAAAAEPALGPYLRAVQAHKLVVVATTIGVVIAAVLWLAFVRVPTYEATAQLLVTPLPQDDRTFLGLQLLRDSGDPTRTVQTAANIVDSPEAAQRTADKLGGGRTTQSVLESVSIEPQGESNILAVTGSADEAGLAARLANTFARETLAVQRGTLEREIGPLLSQLRARREALGVSDTEAAAELEDRINQLENVRTGANPTLSLSQEAEAPPSASGASPVIILALALIAGLALGAGAAVLIELLDRRVRDEDEALAILPVPVLARVPLLRRNLGRLRPSNAWILPPAVREACRTLLLQLRSRNSHDSRVLMVTSGSTGDGKTTSAINLAAALAVSGERVVLLDLDLRKADVARQLAVPQPVQLAELLKPEVALRSLVQKPPSLPTVSVLATAVGEGDAFVLEALYRRLPELVTEARDMADHVIVDTPPLGEISDALRLLDSVDELIVVVRPGNTDRVGLATTADLLARTRSEPAGLLVIGGTPGPASSYYGYGLASRELFVEEQLAPERTSRSAG